ncbi:hypothetical protein F53441_5220 [Fusarium austroafricanum]|uniref:NACHT domain-containing protein n=1 Tax=Fusarium austroafricanum TaxID=2364996 RepID=A0A8H4KLA7_9HYPO|nr:hypothetical protein F53441_5220 [Fusarium austroafricanum]
MSSTSLPREGGLRSRLRQRLSRRSLSYSPDARVTVPRNSPGTPSEIVGAVDQERADESADASLAAFPLGDSGPQDNSTTTNISSIAGTSASAIEVAPTPEIEGITVTSGLWSRAYQEAVQSIGQDVDIAILRGENISQLLKELIEVDKNATDGSVFLRGVAYLKSIQVPLEQFTLVLNVAAPLTTLEPITCAVFGVIKGVTAALVPVYQKLLEFYVSAYELLSKRRTRLVLAVISDTGKLTDIVKEFLKQIKNLRNIVEKVKLEITQDIETMLYEQKISQWLGCDKLTQQSRYHYNLKSIRADSACKFILEMAEFKSWYRAIDYQQLLILGDMGSGKSVMMSFLIDELGERKRHQLPQPMILYHYCQNDETGHALYIFSSLIQSLLRRCVGLRKAFIDWYKQDLLTGNFEPSTSVRKLVGFFQRTVQELDRPLYLVVDGLDECDVESRNTLLKSLRGLSHKTSGLKVVLSSRPWADILEQVDGVPRIEIGAHPERDRIICEKTVQTKLAHLAVDIKRLVVEKLSRFAQGSAIWTNMTVELIARRKIMAYGRMKKFLDTMPLPQELSKLYASLFRRCAGEELDAQGMAATALEVLGAARRRLSILELAWAVAMGTADSGVTSIAELSELVDYQGVLALIQPFVACIDFNDLKKRQVIIVHQSAKEFIWNELSQCRSGHQSVEERPTASGVENSVFNICVRYLLLDEINQVPLLSDEQIAIEELPQNVDLFSDIDATAYTTDCSWEKWEEGMVRYDPADRGFGELFVYASCHWINHFKFVTEDPLPELKCIEKLCQPNSIRLKNWASQSSRPDCVVQARYVFDGSLYDPLSITSLYGSDVLLRKMLENCDFESHKFLPNTAMLAAEQVLQWADLRRLRMLFHGRGTARHLQNLGFFRRIIDSWRFPNINSNDDWDAAFDIINDIPDILVREEWGNELLCLAASRGCLPFIQRLMKLAHQNNDLREELLRGPPREPAHQSIGEAALADHVGVVEYLLEQEGIEEHLHHRNLKGENVLHLASVQCTPAMFRALVPRLPGGISERDCQGKTALMRAIESSRPLQTHVESAQVLLSLSTTHQSERFTEDQQEALQMVEQMQDDLMRNLSTDFNQVSLNRTRSRTSLRVGEKEESQNITAD